MENYRRIPGPLGARLARAGMGRATLAAPTPAQVQANIRHLVADITWYGILVGTTVNFMQVYVVRLGANSLLVSAATYGPALVSILWQFPATQVLRGHGIRIQWSISAGLLHRLAFLIIPLLPFLFATGRAELTVLVLALQALATTLSGTCFNSIMADAVPPEHVPQMMSARMAGYGLTSTISTLLAGQLLLRLPFPLNYQVLFFIGFVASLMSEWHVAHLLVFERPEAHQPQPWRREFGPILRDKTFLRFCGILGLMQIALGVVTPMLPLFWVRHLGASDGQISLIVTIYSASMVIGSLLMRRIARRVGRIRLLAIAGFGYAFYPLLVSLSPSVGWLLPWAMIGGFFFAAMSVTFWDNLVALSPATDRTGYVTIYNLAANAALVIGPLAAALLAQGSHGEGPSLQLAAALSLLAGVLTLLWTRHLRAEHGA